MSKILTTILLHLVTIVTLFSCIDNRTKTNQFDIRGSWYTDLGNGGSFDSLVNYGELYITDSTIECQEEIFGLHSPQRHFIAKDSIYICESAGKECKFIPMFKVERYKSDTLWLTVNKEYVAKNKKPTEFWVRFPEGEKGYYDHEWTSQNKDSLEHAVVNDWNRRLWKYHSYRLGEMDYYDSLLKSGHWDWNMSQVLEVEKKEQEYLDKLKNGR